MSDISLILKDTFVVRGRVKFFKLCSLEVVMFATKVLLFAFLVSSLTASSYGQANSKFFRKGYTFLEDTQSFYRIHTIQRNWKDAKKRCAMEGAMLYFPQDKDEADTVIDFWNQTQPLFRWIHIGVSALQAKGVFESIDGTSIDDLYNNWSVGEPNDANGEEDCVVMTRMGQLNDDRCDRKWPFICKKPLATLEWNTLCDMPDPTYKYNPELGRCYKFHLTPMNWTDAYDTCNAEQSYPAVINSQLEADYLVKLTAEAPKDKIKGNYLAGAVHLGFRNRDDTGWQTIKGSTIEESGYSHWGNQQPDGGCNELCGSMFYNGHLNDIGCQQRCFFICEHEVGILASLFDERMAVINE